MTDAELLTGLRRGETSAFDAIFRDWYPRLVLIADRIVGERQVSEDLTQEVFLELWRRREDSSMIERTYRWAKSRNGVLFLDIQASHSTLQQELPPLLRYLERPDVHLGVDPEFYMHHDKEGVRPSAKIGQMKAADINYVIQTLDRLVTTRKLPPKVLVVHRFTRLMVPDAENIRPTRNVQVVMHMDGWGPPWLKFDSYNHYVVKHPVDFTGFKLFYHNDTKKGDLLLTPRELLQLKPKLSYIQYQ